MTVLIRPLLAAIALLVLVVVNTVMLLWWERKVLGHMQQRMGPMRAGFHGLLQSFADAVKLFAKEDTIPDSADRLLFMLSPILAFIPAFLVYVTIPFTPTLSALELDIGIFYIFAVAALFPIGLLIGGWASHNKYSLLGGFRAAAQQISYEVPMLLSVMGVVMLSNSLKLSGIVEGQTSVWNVVLQPLAFLIYMTTVVAELNRVPFDMPEAESELVAGFNVEYSGARFLIFFLAEYANLFTLAAVATLLFLGGWRGPFLPPLVWFAIKTYFIVFVIIWVRATLPRIRVDQLMDFGWKLLLPFALVNIALTGVGMMTNPVVLVVLEVIAVVAMATLVRRRTVIV